MALVESYDVVDGLHTVSANGRTWREVLVGRRVVGFEQLASPAAADGPHPSRGPSFQPSSEVSSDLLASQRAGLLVLGHWDAFPGAGKGTTWRSVQLGMALGQWTRVLDVAMHPGGLAVLLVTGTLHKPKRRKTLRYSLSLSPREVRERDGEGGVRVRGVPRPRVQTDVVTERVGTCRVVGMCEASSTLKTQIFFPLASVSFVTGSQMSSTRPSSATRFFAGRFGCVVESSTCPDTGDPRPGPARRVPASRRV